MVRQPISYCWQRSNRCSTAVDLTEISTASLHMFIYHELFRYAEQDESYHEDFFDYHRLSGTDKDWRPWFQKDLEWCPWSRQAQSTINHAISDEIAPQMAVQSIVYGREMMPIVAFASLVWGTGMTARTALGSIIFQLLTQRPELLRKRSTAFHLLRFRSIRSFNGLWLVLLDMLVALPGLMIFIYITSTGLEEKNFVRKFLDLLPTWTGPPINLYVAHTPGLFADQRLLQHSVNLDDIYDLPPALKIGDTLHQIVLSLVGVHENISQRMRDCQWDALWRFVRYFSISVAVEEIERSIPVDSCPLTCSGGNPSIAGSQEKHVHILRKEIKQLVSKHIGLLPMNQSQSSAAQLQATAADIVHSRILAFRRVYYHLVPSCPSEWLFRPFSETNRNKIFEATRRVMKDACVTAISMPLATHISQFERGAETIGDRKSRMVDEERHYFRSVLLGYSPPAGTADVLAAAVVDAITAGVSEAIDAFIACHLDCKGPRTGGESFRPEHVSITSSVEVGFTKADRERCLTW
jgi:hypothetical protein